MNLKLRFLPQIIVRTPVNSIDENIDDLVFSEAIYISSCDLYDDLKKTNKQEIEGNLRYKKIKLSLHKYKIRASYRCTPFGLMAGVNTALWRTKNDIKFDTNPKKQFYRKTRLDMNVICEIVKELEKEHFIKPYLKFYPNTSIYLIGNNYRYVEYTYNNNQRQDLKTGSSLGIAGFSAGLGMKILDNYSVDYAFNSMGKVGATHRIDLGFNWK